jgi:hypothetical protein
MNTMQKTEIHEFSGGDLVFWTVEHSSLHIKALTTFGDPVEINADELKDLIAALQKALQNIL